MPQQFLDGTQIGPGIQHMSGKRMSKRMRMHFQPLGKLSDIAIDDVPYASAGQPATTHIQENRLAFGMAHTRFRSPFCFDEIRPHLQIGLQRFPGPSAEGNDAFLGAFADNTHQPFIETDISEVQPDQFPDTYACGI